MEDINIYDGCGIINFNIVKIPFKKLNRLVVAIKCREELSKEPRYCYLKGVYIPFDINNFKSL